MTTLAVLPQRRQMQTIVRKFSGIWFALAPSLDSKHKWWSRGIMTGLNPNHHVDEDAHLKAMNAIKCLSNRGVITHVTVRGPLPTLWFFGPVVQ